MGIDVGGNFFALEEYYGSNRIIREHAFVIRNLLARYGEQDRTLLNPIAEESKPTQHASDIYSLQDAYIREEVRTTVANRASIDVGIDLMKQYLRIDTNRCNPFTQEKGSARLFISRQRCPNHWREMTDLKLEKDNSRTRYIGDGYAVNGLRNILMSRPSAPLLADRDGDELTLRRLGHPSSWMA